MAVHSSGGWSFDVNLKYITDKEEILVAFVDAFVAAGWVVLGRGDGTNLVTDGSEHNVAEWGAAVDTWTHLEDPDGGREITLEWNNTSGVRMYMTRHGIHMTGETAAAAPTAPAGDQAQFIGASGNYETSMINSASYNHHIAANSVPQGTGANTYAWYWIVRSPASGFKRAGCEPVDSPAGVADTEPYMAWANNTASVSSGWCAWYLAGLGGSFVVGGMAIDTFTNRDGDNPYVTGYDLPDIYCYDNTALLQQHKGRLVNMRGEGDNLHATGDDYDLTDSSRARALFDTIAVRWPHNVAPVIT